MQTWGGCGETSLGMGKEPQEREGVPAIWGSNNGKKFLENLRLQPGHDLVQGLILAEGEGRTSQYFLDVDICGCSKPWHLLLLSHTPSLLVRILCL